MLRVGHRGAAMVAYAPIVSLLLEAGQPILAGLGLPLVLLAARLPDLDQRLPFVPHRGPTHTIWFALLAGLPIAFVNPETGLGLWIEVSQGPHIGIPVFGVIPTLGVISHIAADSLTPAGTRPFWPLSDRLVSIDLVRASSPSANRGLFVLGLAGMGVAIWTNLGGAGVG